MAAVLASYAMTTTLGLPQGYWAVFTTLIVMQASVGGTVGASADRMYGTVLGAAVGGVAAWARPQTEVGLAIALVLAGGLTAFVAALRPRLRVAPVTAAIMLLTSAGELGPFQAALDRVIEIALGGVIGVAATLLIFPARGRGVAATRVRAALALLETLLGDYAERLAGREAVDIFPLHERLRGALTSVETALTDAERERTARLGDHRLSAALPRTLWRVRNDAVAVGRAIDTPWPETLAAPLGAQARRMLEADAAFLSACGRALEQDRRIERADLDAAHLRFREAFEALSGEHLTHDLTFDAVGGMFGLAFGLESLFRNLQDLADRIDESALDRPDRAVVANRTKI